MDRQDSGGFLNPSPENIRVILDRYGIQPTRVERAAHGIENLTLFVRADDEEYVLRIYPRQKRSDADIRLELDFMAYLRDGGLPVPAILPSTEDGPLTISELDGERWQSVLMERAHGSHPEAFTTPLLDHMAALQARMHILGERYARAHNIVGIRTTLRGDTLTAGISRDSQDPPLGDFLSRVEAFVVSFDRFLPQGLSHFDYDIENILAEDEGVTAILDFGDIVCMPLVVCLGYTLWDVLFEQGGSPASADRYLQAYEAIRPLEQDEWKTLRDVVLFRHYIITTVRMRLGGFSRDDLDDALQQEQVLATRTWKS